MFDHLRLTVDDETEEVPDGNIYTAFDVISDAQFAKVQPVLEALYEALRRARPFLDNAPGGYRMPKHLRKKIATALALAAGKEIPK
mgnify:CR=1 FL=1